MNPIFVFILKGIIMEWFKARIKEPSTHAGFAVALIAMLPLLPGEWHNIVQGLAVALGGVAVIKKD